MTVGYFLIGPFIVSIYNNLYFNSYGNLVVLEKINTHNVTTIPHRENPIA